MIDYGKAPSNQTQMVIPGVNDESYEEYERAKRWTLDPMNINAWSYFKRYAAERAEASPDGKASPNRCLTEMKERFGISMPNHWATILARIATEECPHIRFRMARSRYDACTRAVL